MNEPPYRIDIEGVGEDAIDDRLSDGLRGRPWIGIHFDCCQVYARIYRNRAATAYRGWCPRCMRSVTLRVGSTGTDSRFFLAE